MAISEKLTRAIVAYGAKQRAYERAWDWGPQSVTEAMGAADKACNHLIEAIEEEMKSAKAQGGRS